MTDPRLEALSATASAFDYSEESAASLRRALEAVRSLEELPLEARADVQRSMVWGYYMLDELALARQWARPESLSPRTDLWLSYTHYDLGAYSDALRTLPSALTVETRPVHCAKLLELVICCKGRLRIERSEEDFTALASERAYMEEMDRPALVQLFESIDHFDEDYRDAATTHFATELDDIRSARSRLDSPPSRTVAAEMARFPPPTTASVARKIDGWLAYIQTDDLSPSAADNVHAFGLSLAEAAVLPAAHIDRFIEDAFSGFAKVVPRGPQPYWFYAWHDEQAGQLRVCAAPATSAAELPFGCRLDVRSSPTPVSEKFLASPYLDGIPLSELTPVAFKDVPVEQPVYVLTVFARELPGRE